MASKRRLRRSGCGSKIKYTNVSDAAIHINRLWVKDKHKMKWYVCPFCRHIHIGHK